MDAVLEQSFLDVYTKFKLRFYGNVFDRFQGREASLTTVETFCMEVIHDRPTVHEFAEFAQISSPNAAYKVNSLIKKGYLTKERSVADKREYHLVPTERFFLYYDISTSYVETVMTRIRKRFDSEEIETFERILNIMSDELMPEIELPVHEKLQDGGIYSSTCKPLDFEE